MRRGIGLRGYAQQDPLNEFRSEAFRLYEELRGLIRHQVATTIFRVTVVHQHAAPSAGDGAGRGAGHAAAPGAATSTAAGGAGSSVRTTTSAAGAAGAAGNAPAGAGAASIGGQGTAAGGAAHGLPSPLPAMRRMQESLGDRPVVGGAGPGGARPGYTPAGQRIGRNDPCYCGSGLKYKKCHGS